MTFDQFIAKKALIADKLNESMEKYARDKEQQQLNEAKQKNDELLVGMSSGYKDTLYNTQRRIRVAANEYLFREEFTKRVLGTLLTNIIEESLLIEQDMYAQLNPNYKKEIRDHVNKLLESSSLNVEIHNDTTKLVLEEINKYMPSNYDAYKLYEEIDIVDVTDKVISNNDVNKAINDLQCDVRERVADIVLRDTENTAALQTDMSEINTAVDNINNNFTNGHDTPELPKKDDVDLSIETEISKNAQEQQNQTVTESYAQGIIESITLNEAKIMLEETGTYNSDLALANAIKFVTILETFGATDLIEINNSTYNNIVSKSVLRKPVGNISMTTNKPIVENVQPVNANSLPTNKQSFEQWLREKEMMKSNSPLTENVVDNRGKYQDKRGKIYTETQLIEHLEDLGYNFRYDNFDDIIKVNGYVKIK